MAVATEKRATSTELRQALKRLCEALDRQTDRYPKSLNVADAHTWGWQVLDWGFTRPPRGDE